MSPRPLGAALVLGAALLSAGCDPDITVEALDTSEECVALLPKPPLRPALAQVQVPATSSCGEATTDERGRLYVSERSPTPGEFSHWHFFDLDGRYEGSEGYLGGPGTGELAPQFEGYFGVRSDATRGLGLEVLREGDTPSSQQVDPLGRTVQRVDLSDAPDLGAFVVASVAASSAGDWAISSNRFAPWGEVYSPQSNVASGPASAAPRNVAGVADRNHRGLAVWETGGNLRARYLRLTGGLLGSEFAIPGVPPLAPLTLQSLLDGGVALKAAGAWRARISMELAGPTVAPPPAWLAATGDSTLARVRNEQGYAVAPASGVSSPTCSQQVQVRTASGKLCGTVTLRQGSTPCLTQPITVGRDGSLIEKAARETCAGATCTCTHRLWSGVLR